MRAYCAIGRRLRPTAADVTLRETPQVQGGDTDGSKGKEGGGHGDRDRAEEDNGAPHDQEGGGASEVTYEMIAERAYHISQSGEGGTDEENWHRAEAELRGA